MLAQYKRIETYIHHTHRLLHLRHRRSHRRRRIHGSFLHNEIRSGWDVVEGRGLLLPFIVQFALIIQDYLIDLDTVPSSLDDKDETDGFDTDVRSSKSRSYLDVLGLLNHAAQICTFGGQFVVL
jgi:hypothetical protein